MDILQELINIGVGRAAGMLNRMVSTHIQLQVPELVVLSVGELISRYGTRKQEIFSAVQLTFSGNFSGVSALLFPPDSACRLVNIILGNSVLGSEASESMRAETLQEVGNIVLNGVMGSIGNILKENIVFSSPDYVRSVSKGWCSSAGPPATRAWSLWPGPISPSRTTSSRARCSFSSA
jgi:chemotaxis protein CheC